MKQRELEYNQLDALYKYVCLYQRKCNRVELETVLKSSPSYPSLLSIYHSLEFCDVHPVVVRAKPENLYGLKRPSLMHIKDAVSEYFLLVECCDKEHIICYDTHKSKYVKRKSETLLSKWDGIMIYTEQQEYRSQRKLFWILTVLMTVVSWFNWASFLLSTNLWGLSISSLLLLNEYGIGTSVTEGVCKIGQSFDCNKVTLSKASRIIGIPLSVWGCLYFLSITLFLLMSRLGGAAQTDVVNYVQIVGLGCLPILAYSVIKQNQMRTWCILCLSIIAILSFETILLVGWNEHFAYSFIAQLAMLHLLGIGIAGIFLSLLVKGVRLYKEYTSLRVHDLKIKRNPEILQLLFKNAKVLNRFDSSYMSLGNPQASVVITTWLSPYCVHCSKLVKDMLDLYNRHGKNIEWRIYISGYASGEREKNRIQHTLMTWYMKDKLLFLNALNRWFIHKELIPTEDSNILFSDETEHHLEKQILFTREMNINSYPKCFINGLELPSVYTIKDIFYMVHDENIWKNLIKEYKIYDEK